MPSAILVGIVILCTPAPPRRECVCGFASKHTSLCISTRRPLSNTFVRVGLTPTLILRGLARSKTLAQNSNAGRTVLPDSNGSEAYLVGRADGINTEAAPCCCAGGLCWALMAFGLLFFSLSGKIGETTLMVFLVRIFFCDTKDLWMGISLTRSEGTLQTLFFPSFSEFFST